MNCKNCGMMINPGENMCRNCGMVVDNGVQQMNYQNYQQPMGQPVPPMGGYNPNMQGYNNQPPKSNGGVIIAVVAIIAVLVIGVTVFLVKGSTDNDSNETSNTTTVAVATTKVKVGNYTFDVPSNYTYEIYDGFVYVTDNQNWQLEIGGSEYNYSQIKAKRNSLVGETSSNGMTYSNPQIKTYSGVEFLVYDATKGNTKAIVGFAKGINNKAIVIAAYNKNYTIDYNLLEKIAPIVKSATYSTSSHSINQNNDIKFGVTMRDMFNTNNTTPTTQQQPLS